MPSFRGITHRSQSFGVSHTDQPKFGVSHTFILVSGFYTRMNKDSGFHTQTRASGYRPQEFGVLPTRLRGITHSRGEIRPKIASKIRLMRKQTDRLTRILTRNNTRRLWIRLNSAMPMPTAKLAETPRQNDPCAKRYSEGHVRIQSWAPEARQELACQREKV